jgi:hypothetical protein
MARDAIRVSYVDSSSYGVSQLQLRVSVRAEQQSSEKSCRVAGERILRYWKTGNE